MNSELENTSPQFVCYDKRTIINELRKFGCDVYPTNSSPKKTGDRTQQG